ncbi:MAG: glycosyltransferase family 2 protein [Candidatus Peregrinibacteria bacterium]|nr:glycosyltransferase family 2 protein [Candidatus Peregrinibacteria bacterium]
MKISIIIPTYNRADILTMCLNALEKQKFPVKDFEVIVVNDGSKDETDEILTKFAKGKLNLIPLRQGNAGQGAARNRALKKASGEVVILIGDDMIAPKTFLSEHWKSHTEHPDLKVAILGLIDWHPDLEITPYMQWMVNGSSIFGKFGGHQFAYEKLNRGDQPNFNFFYTSNLSLKREFLGENPFDLDFSKYGWEDIELGYRLQKEKGMKMVYNRKAVTQHYHPMDESGLAKRMEMIGRSAHIIDSKYPELKKVPPAWKQLAFWLLSNPLSLGLIKLSNWITRGKLQALYYYGLSKKYFLKGVKSGII